MGGGGGGRRTVSRAAVSDFRLNFVKTFHGCVDDPAKFDTTLSVNLGGLFRHDFKFKSYDDKPS